MIPVLNVPLIDANNFSSVSGPTEAQASQVARW